MRAQVIAVLLVAGCSEAGPVEHAAPRSAVQARNVDPALPEERPTPFEVELRRRSGAESMLLRATDRGLSWTVDRDGHALTVTMPADAAALDEVHRVLRDSAIQDIEEHPNPDAEVDGTSIRLLEGRRRISATRMGQFEPLPEHTERYEACIAAIEGLVDGGDTEPDEGVPLEITFDASMANRQASVEVEATDVVSLQSSPELTLRVPAPTRLSLHLRFGPPAQEVEQTVDLATTHRVLVTIDPELARPTIALPPHAD